MRKIITIIIILSLTAFRSFSQSGDTSDTTYWGISLYGSVDYNLNMVKGSTSSGQDAGFMKDIDLPRIGYTVGFSIKRPIYKMLSLEFGIACQSQGYRTSTLSDTVWNYRDSAIAFYDYHKAYQYYSINIPVVLKVDLFHIKKAVIGLGVGVAPVISLGKKQVLFFDDHKEVINEKSGAAIDLQAIGNLNVYIPVSKKISLTLEPTFRYNILQYKDSYYEGVSRNLFSAGLGIYLTYKLTDNEMYDYYYKKIYNVKNLNPKF